MSDVDRSRSRWRWSRRWGGAALALAAASGVAHADGADEPDVPAVRADEIRLLREEMHAMEARHRAEMEALRAEMARQSQGQGGDLTTEIDALLDRVDGLEASLDARPRGTAAVRLVDISLNGLIAGGASSEKDSVVEALNAGGHDPGRRGFTVQNVELVLKGAVDPYFTAQANIVYTLDTAGESVVELEEAFAQTTSLPWGLQAKAGQFFTAFGRHNPQHPHQWEFVDMPFGWTRFFGPDGMRGQGAQISWLLPTETPIEIVGAIQNANGETMSSFLGANGEEPFGEFTFGSQRAREVTSFDDLVWSARGTVSLDLSDEWTTLAGVSSAFGPNAGGSGTNTWVRGLDLTARWKPLDNRRGFPFVDTRFEIAARDYEFDAFRDADGTPQGAGSLDDSSWYLQSTWGFTTDWTVAGRYEDFAGDAPGGDVPGLEDRSRWSLAVSHYLTEYSKLRLQVNRDDSDVYGNATSVWLQLEFNLGSHGAHTF